ncbi:DUF6402 family protein [Pantoea leporis]|uniref:DUF6402 family protein n=1 Tax=Pantoea leporis TaxID=2933780 RepID=UPI002303114C|nr:DUF6402 family protein [Pantoea leporis]
MNLATTTTSTLMNKKTKEVEVEFFHIDMIPDAMDKMNWSVAAKLMRHWFSISPAYAFTEQSKRAALKNDATNLPDTQVNSDIIKISWAMQNDQVKKGVNELRSTWKSVRGIERLKFQISKGNINKNNEKKLGYSDSIRELDANAQVNIMKIGNKLDTINEWYGAMGNTTLKVCIRGRTNIIDNTFIVDKIGFYLKDSYDFVDDDGNSEPLGIWSKERILDKKTSAFYMSTYLSGVWGLLVRNYSGFVPIFNSDFRRWQEKHNTGGDFIVLSDVLWMEPLPKDKVIKL